MECALCRFEYAEGESVRACLGCPMSRGKCRLQKCPNCGYETPTEPRLVKFLRRRRRKLRNET